MKKKRHTPYGKARGQKKDSSSLFYVGIRDPTETHRTILECARDSIRLLQQYEKIKAIREEKLQTTLKLDTEMKQLRGLMNKLKSFFPLSKFNVSIPTHVHPHMLKCAVCDQTFGNQVKLAKHLHTHQKKVHAHKKVAKKPQSEQPTQFSETPPPKKKQRPLSDLEQLEKELSDIEGKLGGLS